MLKKIKKVKKKLLTIECHHAIIYMWLGDRRQPIRNVPCQLNTAIFGNLPRRQAGNRRRGCRRRGEALYRRAEKLDMEAVKIEND